MSRQPEGRLVKNILDFLNANYPGYWRKIHGGPFQRRGIPDILGCYRGRFVGIEVKEKGNKPTMLQIDNGKEIIGRGKGIWMVAYSVDDVKKAMQKHFKKVVNDELQYS